jgi:hypothetical protein
LSRHGAQRPRAVRPFGFLLGLRVALEPNGGENVHSLVARLISFDGRIVTDPKAARTALDAILNDPGAAQLAAIAA